MGHGQAMRNRRIAILLFAGLATAACDDVWQHFSGGVSGHSFLVGDQFVILRNGYRRGKVTWVAVRNWPATSTTEERLADRRLVLGSDGEFRVRAPDGVLRAPEPNVAYVFDGDRVVTFAIRMQEDDFIEFRTERLKDYGDVEAFLRRFEDGKAGAPVSDGTATVNASRTLRGAEALPASNPIAAYLEGAELQAEQDQMRNICAALRDLAALTSREQRDERYEDYGGTAGAWDLPTVLRSHFVPVSPARHLPEGRLFWANVEAHAVRSLAWRLYRQHECSATADSDP